MDSGESFVSLQACESSKSSCSVVENGKRKWSRDEDDLLKEAVEKYGEGHWSDISRLVESRNPAQCLNRYVRYIRPGIKKGPWTVEEDATLVLLISEGSSSWSEIADNLGSRSSKQCRERWANHLDPAINKGSFSDEEDNKILELQANLGNHWAAIAKQVDGRTENSVKARYLALTRSKEKGIAPEFIRKNHKHSRNALHQDIQEVGLKLLKIKQSRTNGGR